MIGRIEHQLTSSRNRSTATGQPRLRVLAIALSLALFGSLARPPAATAQPKREQKWKRADSAHFTFFTTGSERAAAQLAKNMETLRALIASLAPSGAPGSPRPTFVYVFRSDEAFRPYQPIENGKPANYSSYFSPRREANYISLDGSGDVRTPAFTSYAFDFVGTHLPNIPEWLHRGLAEYYGTFRVSPKSLDVGRPDDGNLRELNQSFLMKMEDLVAMTRDSPALRDRTRFRRFAAQSWATVHYLIHDERRRGQLPKYMHLVSQGVPEADAFQASFGAAPSEMTVEIFSYINSRRFFFAKIPPEQVEVDPSFAMQPVAWDEMLYRLGDLLAGWDDRRDETAAHYRAALAANPKQSGGHTGLGILEYQSNNYDGAIAELERAIALDPGDFRANLFLAMAIDSTQTLGNGWWEELPEEHRQNLERIRAAATRCLESEPEHAACHSQLGFTYFWDRDPARGVEALETALRLQPVREWTALNLIQLLRNAGEPERAKQLLAAYHERFDPAQRSQAASAVQRARHYAVDRCLEREDFAGAITHLEAALAETTDAAEQERLRQRLSQVKQRAAG